METFNLKTAVALLPVMNDKGSVTKQLISSIEMYNCMLDKNSKPLLVQFILKTRLSENAIILTCTLYLFKKWGQR